MSSEIRIAQNGGKRPGEDAFWRKSARGKLKMQKIVREHYLRDSTELETLPATDKTFVVVDTNVVLKQLDLLGNAGFPHVVVVPQTVMDETRHRSLALFNKVNGLMQEYFEDEGHVQVHRAYVFWNEACRETYVPYVGEESINDRNDRAVVETARFLLVEKKRRVVFLSDDKEQVRRGKHAGVDSYSTDAFVDSLGPQYLHLGDLVNRANTSFEKAEVFPAHLPQGTIEAGISSGKLKKGHFRPDAYVTQQGTVSVSGTGQQLIARGKIGMNRAISGDLVAVEELPRSQWVRDSDKLVAEDENDEVDANDEAGPLLPTAKVVGILRRQTRAYVCQVDESSVNPGMLGSLQAQTILAQPVDKQLPKIEMTTRQLDKLNGTKFLVGIDAWSERTLHPEGHLVRVLGPIGDKATELESLLEEYEVPSKPFSRAILECLPDEGDNWKVPPKSDPRWHGRKDIREELVCSIDPPGCQDIDDALHAKRLDNGNIQAGVHIADVSHFVLPENAMDREAAQRGNTVYMVDRRIDMLPMLLGTNLCSLRPFVERFAFSVVWELTPQGDIVDTQFFKSVIQSKEAFTYEAAQKRIDDAALTDPLTDGMRLLNHVAKILKQKRLDAGALQLASPELRIQLDSDESSDPIDIQQKQAFDTNSLVEEFMLLANVSVADKIYSHFSHTAVLRCHPSPPASNFATLSDILVKRKGIVLDTSSSKALAESLDTITGGPSDPDVNMLVRIMATRCMLSAEYICSGSVSKSSYRHYGLATPMYTHFTSPIRRYADVLVHRQLAAAIGHAPLPAGLESRDYVSRLLDNVNRRHKRAQQAGRASIEYHVALAIGLKERKAPVMSDAYVIRVFKNGIAVYVPEYGLEGLVSFKKDQPLDADNYTLQLGGHTVGVFDRVRVGISVHVDSTSQRGQKVLWLASPVDSRDL